MASPYQMMQAKVVEEILDRCVPPALRTPPRQAARRGQSRPLDLSRQDY